MTANVIVVAVTVSHGGGRGRLALMGPVASLGRGAEAATTGPGPTAPSPREWSPLRTPLLRSGRLRRPSARSSRGGGCQLDLRVKREEEDVKGVGHGRSRLPPHVVQRRASVIE